MRLQIYKLFLTNGLVFPRFYNIFATLTRRSIAFSITEGPGRKFLPHPQDATSITTRPSLPDATSPDGGIGRRAGLKHQWSNPCRFDPGSGYTRMQVLDFQTLAFSFSFLHHDCTTENFVDCRSLAGYQVHLFRKTALGSLFFRGIKSSFTMFLH